MSAHKSRFFQHADSSVVRVSHPAYMRDYEEDPTVTEVQVVPSDAIVIRRDELPEVDTAHGARVNSVGIGWALDYLTADRAEKARSYGLAYLALAEHLREHPPVDEEQVASLFEVLTEEWFPADDGERASTLARRLVERGVRLEQA